MGLPLLQAASKRELKTNAAVVARSAEWNWMEISLHWKSPLQSSGAEKKLTVPKGQKNRGNLTAENNKNWEMDFELCSRASRGGHGATKRLSGDAHPRQRRRVQALIIIHMQRVHLHTCSAPHHHHRLLSSSFTLPRTTTNVRTYTIPYSRRYKNTAAALTIHPTDAAAKPPAYRSLLFPSRQKLNNVPRGRDSPENKAALLLTNSVNNEARFSDNCDKYS